MTSYNGSLFLVADTGFIGALLNDQIRKKGGGESGKSHA